MAVNIIRTNTTYDKIYKHDEFSASILDSFSSPYDLPCGVAMNTNVYTNAQSSDHQKMYKHDGFSITILDSFSSPGALPGGIAWDSGDFYSVCSGEDKIYKHDGFSSVILSSFASYNPTGLALEQTGC